MAEVDPTAVAQFMELLATVAPEDGKLEFKLPEGATVIDLGQAFPVNMGDWMDLYDAGYMDERGMIVQKGPATIANVILHFCKKINPAISIDGIRALDITKLSRAFLFVNKLLSSEGDLNPTK